MFFEFNTTTHGKWILAGEHAVIRGSTALVFPIPEKILTMRYSPSSSTLTAEYEGDSGPDMHLLFWSVLEQGMHLLGKSLNRLSGNFHLYSNIPIGVGMGASAALCVATTRWFIAQGMLPENNLYEFAKELENLFHGQSSGLDIAGVSAESGISFQQGSFTKLQQHWKPQWYLSSCGQIGITSHCIQQVKTLWADHPTLAQEIDQQMINSVSEARSALACHMPESQLKLAHAMNMAGHCFKQWGLVSESLQQHLNTLRQAGAIAAKPTGSGGGGYALSLWNATPADSVHFNLIPV